MNTHTPQDTPIPGGKFNVNCLKTYDESQPGEEKCHLDSRQGNLPVKKYDGERSLVSLWPATISNLWQSWTLLSSGPE